MPNTVWTIEFEPRAERALGDLDAVVRRRILGFIRSRLAEHPEPRLLGEPLAGKLSQLTRWRVGDYRIVGRIVDRQLIIVVVTIGHRREVYR